MPRQHNHKSITNKVKYHRKRQFTMNQVKLYQSEDEIDQEMIGSLLLDQDGVYVGHCGSWHVVSSVPLRVPCCGVVLFEVSGED